MAFNFSPAPAQIPELQREAYLARLEAPRKNSTRTFGSMLRSGDRGELDVKNCFGKPYTRFMSPRSSARLPFDLFSALDGLADTLALEKKLPGIPGSKRRPNMDAYYEAGGEIVFIESKYKEEFNRAYIGPAGASGDPLGASYYDASPEDTLVRNFYGDRGVAALFSTFCREVGEAFPAFARTPEGFMWFNAKQQTTHLYGIIGWLLHWGAELGRRDFRGRHVTLLTTVWQMANDTVTLDRPGAFPCFFKQKAEQLLAEVIGAHSLGCTFSYEAPPVQILVLPAIATLHDLRPFSYGRSMAQLLSQYAPASLANRQRRRHLLTKHPYHVDPQCPGKPPIDTASF